jgi:hypothetical protein
MMAYNNQQLLVHYLKSAGFLTFNAGLCSHDSAFCPFLSASFTWTA